MAPDSGNAASLRPISILEHGKQSGSICCGQCESRIAADLAQRIASVTLGSANDLWYLGGGAFQPRTFGYTGRPANGHEALAGVWDVNADYSVVKNFVVGLYYGHAWGGSAIESLYPKNANGQMAYLETNFAVLDSKWRIEKRRVVRTRWFAVGSVW